MANYEISEEDRKKFVEELIDDKYDELIIDFDKKWNKEQYLENINDKRLDYLSKIKIDEEIKINEEIPFEDELKDSPELYIDSRDRKLKGPSIFEMIYVSKISRKFHRTLKYYINYSIQNIESSVIGETFSRDRNVNERIQGIFIEFYIRRYLSIKYNLDLPYINRRSELNAESIEKYLNKRFNNESILEDIFNVSLGEGNRYTSIPNIRYIEEYLPKDCRIQLIHILNMKDIFPQNIQFNVLMIKNFRLEGVADLVISNDHIMDFKCSTDGTGSEIKDFYQLFLYALISPTKINKLTIFNPLNSTFYSVDISQWDMTKIKQLFDL